jgi:Rieske 2Fe-2S family protein
MTMSFLKTVETYQQGARTLSGDYYTSPEIFAEEERLIFRQHWLCVGRAERIPAAGDYMLATIAGESIILLRDHQGGLRAFYNVCRHRGTRLCEAARGSFSETIQCPYHAWTYDLSGQLIGAPHMREAAGFDKGAYPLHAAALAEWEGFLFVNLAPHPEPFGQAFAPILDRFARFNLAKLITPKRAEYSVQANWKLILQNYNECLHCPTIHPELSTKLLYTSGENDLVEGPFLGGYMMIKAPNASATVSGRICALPLSQLPEEQQRAYYYTLFPNMMLSVHPDYVVYYMVSPRSPGESHIVCEWMVHPDSLRSPSYNIQEAEDFWTLTNEQDWRICEQSQAGVRSQAYQPGPYSPRESICAAWDREFLRALGLIT